jgi:hypothetical protein
MLKYPELHAVFTKLAEDYDRRMSGPESRMRAMDWEGRTHDKCQELARDIECDQADMLALATMACAALASRQRLVDTWNEQSDAVVTRAAQRAGFSFGDRENAIAQLVDNAVEPDC